MKILALDTASSICAACLIHDGQNGARTMLAQASEVIGTGHAERLMPMVQELIGKAGVLYSDIGLVAVSIGPGSFTGVRTGVAAAKGFAQALKIPAIGISTLEALAFEARKNVGDKPLRVVIDAKRGEVHCQDFDGNGSAESVPVLLSLADAKGGRGGRILAGNGAALVDIEAPNFLPHAATASIVIFSEMALQRRGIDTTSLTIMPLYLRGADAKPQTGFAVRRATAG